MLLQSHAGELAFLPALPSAWPAGHVEGLRARGAVEVDLAWSGGKAERAVLRPAVAGPVRLRAPRGQQIVSIQPGPAVPSAPQEVVEVKLDARREYTVRFR